MLVLNLYEFLENIPQIFGRDFMNSLPDVENNELLVEHKSIKRPFKILKQKVIHI